MFTPGWGEGGEWKPDLHRRSPWGGVREVSGNLTCTGDVHSRGWFRRLTGNRGGHLERAERLILGHRVSSPTDQVSASGLGTRHVRCMILEGGQAGPREQWRLTLLDAGGRGLTGAMGLAEPGVGTRGPRGGASCLLTGPSRGLYTPRPSTAQM